MSGKVLTIDTAGNRVERPTSFLTVAAAELASFLPGEICSVLETRRFYQFDADSEEVRDGSRVLAPAGGGRLLHAPWVMNATEIEFSTPTVHLPDLQAVVSHNWSAALMDGGGFTDNGDGTYSVAAAEAALRQPTGGQGATIGLYNVAAVSSQSIADGTQTYVTVKLTGSTAAYATQQDLSMITGRDEIEAYSITRVGNDYHVVDLRRQNVDHAQLACRMEWDTKGISKVPGTAYSSSASNRYLQVSAGKFHVPIRLSAIAAFDTSGSSTFIQIHGSTASGWTRTPGQTQINNTNYNNGTGTLATLTANQWGVRWVFMDVDSSGAGLVVLIGPNNGSEAEANAASLPSDLPPELRKTAPGVLISKIVIQKNAESITASWISNFDAVTQRQSAPATEHNSLSGILGNGFYHLSESERDAAIRIATTSQSGLMSAAQAQSVVNSTVAGSSGQLQYNNNGSLGADQDFTWDYANKRLGVGTPSQAAKAHIKGAGSTGGTSALKVDNSTDAELFLVKDDGNISLGSFYLKEIAMGYNSGGVGFSGGSIWQNGASFFVFGESRSASAGYMALRYGGGNGTTGGSSALWQVINRKNGSDINVITANSDQNIGIGTTSQTARTHIKGPTSDSTAYVLKLDNISNAKNFYVRCDGQIDSSGSRIIGHESFTTDATLTQSSKSTAVANPSGAGMVLTLHLSPPDGIKQVIVNASVYSVTIGRNGQKIAGLESNYTLAQNSSIVLQFFGATLGWLIISNG